MPLIKSLHLKVPNTKPFDKEDCWFESFVGQHLRSLLEGPSIRRFWFSRYGLPGNYTVKLRFEMQENELIPLSVNALIGKFGLAEDGFVDYIFADDIGYGEKSRFIGSESRSNRNQRGNLAFDFVHASAKLFLDCLSGPDRDGYYWREREMESHFNFQTPLEQYHHLFCNLTGTPTFVTLAQHTQKPGFHAFTPFQFAALQKADSQWTSLAPVLVQY
jgi:hypothetical protein